ncbi:MAG: type II secretion system protein GspL [Pseudomonadota bacterium]
MTRRLYGSLNDETESAPRLIRLTSSGFEDVSTARDSDEVVLFVPGTAVSIFRKPLPTRGNRQSRQAAPFAIEDDVAEPIEAVHIALGPEPNDISEPRELHIVDDDHMRAWLQTLSNYGLSDAQLFAEQSFVNEGELVDIDERLLAHTSQGPLAYDKRMPEELFTALIDGEEIREHRPEDWLAFLAQRFEAAENPGVNLRQGPFGLHGQSMFSSWRDWRLAASLALVCGIATMASGFADISAKNVATAEIRENISSSYRQAFPDASTTTDPVRAVSRALGDVDTGPAMDFLDTSAVLYAALADVPSASVRAVRYDPRRGGYVASIAYVAYGDDAALQSALEERGYMATLGDARRGGDFVFGDVTVALGSGQ